MSRGNKKGIRQATIASQKDFGSITSVLAKSILEITKLFECIKKVPYGL